MTLLAPLRIEALALRGAGDVVRTGMGASASAKDARDPLIVAGFAGGLNDDLRPGDVVVATEVIGPDGERIACVGAHELEIRLAAAGLRVRRGPIATSRRIVRGAQRERLAQTGALAADLESYWLAVRGRPLAVARVIVDTRGRELTNPFATLRGGVVAYRVLKRAAGPLAACRVRSLDPTTLNEEPCPSL